ncbi:hypothetical protein [Petropleomorpha daqingensis]|uniref:Uncharacterized protein n=1 Tax=Petropleomorpha daqingensis TaxID=2026353 RepID=A0A853CK13_9ACTN|nr:hypothetical protein [Petropleomorpha daqingensis]NYJ07219.1 hypothetical protein [Petropleomorpha daqingensis]
MLNGSGAPANSVGHDGDFYIDTATTTLYGPKANGVWPTPGTSLVGPQGAAGSSGAQPFSVIGTPAAEGDRIFNGGQAEVEAFCGSAPEMRVANRPGATGIVVRGFVAPTSGSQAYFDNGSDALDPLSTGSVSFQGTTTFGQQAGLTTGNLLVTQGSTTFTVTFALSGDNSGSCVVTAQVTPTS